ncbi:MAG: hypothetical protein H7328_10945 [Bdellovibrio sp.]|nr:hypothetical protein [Bdellovibrio sp.]
MRKLIVVSSLMLLAIYTQAQSETTTKTTTTPAGVEKVDLKEALAQKKFQENTEITDTKLKAESGSLSTYSLSLNLTYYGPTVGDLSAKDQPNPDGSPGAFETSLGGALGGRYRFSPRSTITAGSGLKAIHPFHGMEKFETNNPYINYNLSDRIGDVQMRNSIGFSSITYSGYTKIGEIASLGYDNSMVYNLGFTPLAIGLDTSIAYYFYNRGYQSSDGKASRYTISAYPNAKYNLTDKLNINTSIGFSSFNLRKLDDQSVLGNRSITQRLGVGYAYTRDVYLSPYLNFYPDNLSPDGTTINFSAILSVL